MDGHRLEQSRSTTDWQSARPPISCVSGILVVSRKQNVISTLSSFFYNTSRSGHQKVAPRMHHILPFWARKTKKNFWGGETPSINPTSIGASTLVPSALGPLSSSSIIRSLCMTLCNWKIASDRNGSKHCWSQPKFDICDKCVSPIAVVVKRYTYICDTHEILFGNYRRQRWETADPFVNKTNID